jgi:hypothetical protein
MCLAFLMRMFMKDRNGKPERGEWMGADKISTEEFGLWTQFHSDTSACTSCQVHIANRVLLNLGARPNQWPIETHIRKQLKTFTSIQNRSGRFLKPVRPTFWDLASHRQRKPIRPVWQTGQAGFLQEIPKRSLLTFLSLTTRLAQLATAAEMLVGTYKRRRRVHTSSNGAKECLG